MNNNGTRFEFLSSGKSPAANEVLLVPLPAKPRPPMSLLAPIDALCEDAVSQLVDLGALGEDAGKLAHSSRSNGFRRILLVSLGDTAQLMAGKVRQAGAAAADWLIAQRITQASLWLDGLDATQVEHASAEFATGLILAGFRFGELKKADEKRPALIRVSLRAIQPERARQDLRRIQAAQCVADSVNYMRSVAHRPPNILHPPALAAEARKLAKSQGLKCQVLDVPKLRAMNLNGLLSVGMAASHKPCLIRLDYRGAPRSRHTTVVIGKAVTFDTGGISIKPAAGMEGMKFDKCGGMVVLGVLRAISELKMKCNVIGLIAAAENAVSDDAYRPSDIIRMANGKTVEIISTDAEGRMVLADALWYAQKVCKPRAMINLATLTGAVTIALGRPCAAIMSNNDELAAELGESGRRTHERLWRLPLWDDYKDLIKGNDSDLRNSSGKRDAGTIVGGMFLKEFVDDKTPWAHLDIAAVATTENDKAATGFGVRLLVDYLQRRAE